MFDLLRCELLDAIETIALFVAGLTGALAIALPCLSLSCPDLYGPSKSDLCISMKKYGNSMSDDIVVLSELYFCLTRARGERYAIQ